MCQEFQSQALELRHCCTIQNLVKPASTDYRNENYKGDDHTTESRTMRLALNSKVPRFNQNLELLRAVQLRRHLLAHAGQPAPGLGSQTCSCMFCSIGFSKWIPPTQGSTRCLPKKHACLSQCRWQTSGPLGPRLVAA